MSFWDSLRNWWKKPPSGFVTRWRLIITIGLGILVYVGQFTSVFAVKPTATLECESWRMPCCMNKELTDPGIPAIHVDPNRIVEFLKAQGMYHIFVQNDSGRTIENARVTIPDAFYVEVRRYAGSKRDDARPEEATVHPYPGSWGLGDIDNGYTFEVNAWAKDKPSRELAREISINHETKDGHSVTPTIVGIWINEYTFWAALAAAALALGPLVIYICKFCRYFCGLAGQKQERP